MPYYARVACCVLRTAPFSNRFSFAARSESDGGEEWRVKFLSCGVDFFVCVCVCGSLGVTLGSGEPPPCRGGAPPSARRGL